MKRLCLVVVSLLFSTLLQAQDAGTITSSGLTTGTSQQAYKTDFGLSSDSFTAPAQRTPGGTVQYNMYGNLREDNPDYNRKSPWWLCAIRVVGNNVVTWAADRFIFNADYATIGPDTWKHNLQTGLEWDTDRFGMNYFFHPYSGAGYFNAARSKGHNFYESVPFAFGGSLSIGFEQLVYYCDRYPRDYPHVHDVRTEQKIFLQSSIDNFKQER